MVISHNIEAMNTQRQYNIVTDKRRKDTEKLSSGYRINRAADDAAGLTISEKMRWQIRGLNRASANIQDGISFVQVAEGALGEVHSMLHRMNELSIQAANDTNTDDDRNALDKEMQQIKTEMKRVFDDTMFNTRKVWDGSILEAKEITKYRDVSAVTFNSESISNVINNTNKWAVPKTNYTIAANETGMTISWTGYNDKKYSSKLIPWDTDIKGNHVVNLADHMDYTMYPEAAGLNARLNYTVNENSELSDTIKALNGKTLTSTVSTYQYGKGYSYSGSSLNGISFSATVNYKAQLDSGKDMEAEDTVFIEGKKNGSGDYENVTNPARGSSSTPFGFSFDMPGVGTVNAKYSSATYSASTAEPDNGIWWKWVTRSNGTKYQSINSFSTTPNDGSLDAIFNSAINGTANQGLSNSLAGGSIKLSYNLYDSSSKSIGTMSMTVSISSGENLDHIKNRLADLKGVDIYANSSKGTSSARLSSGKSSNMVKEPYKEMEYIFSDDNIINIQSGATKDNVFKIVYPNMSLEYLGIENSEITDYSKASLSIEKVSDALAKVSEQRSLFGAYQNRMEHAMSVDDYTSENTSIAESRIRDTDMAKQMVEFSKNNILAQVGESFLTQVNQRSSNVLSLLS